MSQVLEIQQLDNGTTRCVKLIGAMIEAVPYGVIDPGQAEVVEFDFAGVTMINSKGIQLWKDFMRGLSGNTRIVYVRCPLKVVNQLNLFPGFKGGKAVDVASFYAPYFCEFCDKPHSNLIVTARDFPGGRVGNPPAANCPSCSKPMDFDGNAQKYFLFLKRGG